MGAPAVAAVAGSIITSVLVSKAATMIAEKIGLDGNMAQLVGMAAGGMAGHYVYGEAMAAANAAPTGTTTTDMSAAGTVTDAAPLQSAQNTMTGTEAAQSLVNPTPTQASQFDLAGEATGVVQGAGEPTAGQGMLSKFGNAPSPGGAGIKVDAPSVQSVNAPQVGNKGLVGQKPPPESESWFDKILSSDKWIDVGVAGVQGMAQKDLADEEYRRQKRDEEERIQGWVDKYGSDQLTLNTSRNAWGYQ